MIWRWQKKLAENSIAVPTGCWAFGTANRGTAHHHLPGVGGLGTITGRKYGRIQRRTRLGRRKNIVAKYYPIKARNLYQMAVWPSGLRRLTRNQFRSRAHVRIMQPSLYSFFPLFFPPIFC
ncbi:hypothetical protein VN97_g2663 [Penicillium thymicola]|uniref:Uncharacterized protein n=1 Tax=Penicillium thymicola TaxID=293382 RepID=A0AAI9XB44_PENTH|nr:hypothetical protein VN97_g2663 [Penicillium thymicola]